MVRIENMECQQSQNRKSLRTIFLTLGSRKGNFYYGRKDADITQWLEYIVGVMASTFETVQKKVEELYENNEVKFDTSQVFINN